MINEFTESIDLLNRELEQLIREKDDFLEITTLPTLASWEALVRKMDAEEKLKMDALVIEGDPSAMRLIQGYLQAFSAIKDTVADAADQSKIRQDEIGRLMQQKDEILAQEE